jgi:hypothetical protein
MGCRDRGGHPGHGAGGSTVSRSGLAPVVIRVARSLSLPLDELKGPAGTTRLTPADNPKPHEDIER